MTDNLKSAEEAIEKEVGFRVILQSLNAGIIEWPSGSWRSARANEILLWQAAVNRELLLQEIREENKKLKRYHDEASQFLSSLETGWETDSAASPKIDFVSLTQEEKANE